MRRGACPMVPSGNALPQIRWRWPPGDLLRMASTIVVGIVWGVLTLLPALQLMVALPK